MTHEIYLAPEIEEITEVVGNYPVKEFPMDVASKGNGDRYGSLLAKGKHLVTSTGAEKTFFDLHGFDSRGRLLKRRQSNSSQI